MGRTAVNVAGQALVPTIVAKREGIIDLAVLQLRAHRGKAWREDAPTGGARHGVLTEQTTLEAPVPRHRRTRYRASGPRIAGPSNVDVLGNNDRRWPP